MSQLELKDFDIDQFIREVTNKTCICFGADLAGAFLIDDDDLKPFDNKYPGINEQQKKSIIDGLRAAAEIVEREKLLLVLEPLNILVDHAGQFLSSSLEAFEIVKEAGSASVKVLFDIYHQQVTEGNLTANIRDHIDLIGHFHVADVPGRHEPGTGEINYVNLFREIERTGYQGYVGLEYLPLGEVEEPLRKVIDIAKAASLKVES